MALARLDNGTARRLYLAAQALAEPPTGPADGAPLLALIRRLGFVQVDSINTVERAHHMILWARRQSYRPENLVPLLERDRTLFEHWTHDASVIPTEFLPFWQMRFARDHAALPDRWAGWQGREFQARADGVLAQIRANGPTGPGEVGLDEARGKGGWWDWHPSKAALEYLWRAGHLAVTRRDGFAKIYDLAERVYPSCPTPPDQETVDWACGTALDRLAFATSGEIAAFWGKVTPAEARDWCLAAQARGELDELQVENADGSTRRHFCRPALIDTATAAAAAGLPGRARILSPFDPMLRDRARAERLFGFRYRIEVFVPAPKRRYGYYVFPVLEGDRLIGRIDLKCRREAGQLAVTAFWPEAGVRMGQGRLERLMAELERLGRFTRCPDLQFADGWLRQAAPADP